MNNSLSLDDASEQLQTDKNGQFQTAALGAVTNGKGAACQIYVSHPRLSSIEKRFFLRPHYAPGDATTLNLVMPARAIIQGRLTFQGRPARDAYISVNSSLESLEDKAPPTTNAQGFYSFSVSAPATCTFGFSKEDSFQTTVKLQAVPGRTYTLNRALEPIPYGAIVGRVTDFSGKPVPNVHLELWTPRTSETGTAATTDRNGRYRIEKVAPFNEYRVAANSPRSELRNAFANRSPVRVHPHRTTTVNLRGDVVPPQCRLLWPKNGAKVNGVIRVKIAATDNRALKFGHVEVDGKWGIDDESSTGGADFKPLKKSEIVVVWDTGTVPNGTHTLTARVYDQWGNAATHSIKVLVQSSHAKPDALRPDNRKGQARPNGF